MDKYENLGLIGEILLFSIIKEKINLKIVFSPLEARSVKSKSFISKLLILFNFCFNDFKGVKEPFHFSGHVRKVLYFILEFLDSFIFTLCSSIKLKL